MEDQATASLRQTGKEYKIAQMQSQFFPADRHALNNKQNESAPFSFAHQHLRLRLHMHIFLLSLLSRVFKQISTYICSYLQAILRANFFKRSATMTASRLN